jgi:hypothetical protein
MRSKRVHALSPAFSYRYALMGHAIRGKQPRHNELFGRLDSAFWGVRLRKDVRGIAERIVRFHTKGRHRDDADKSDKGEDKRVFHQALPRLIQEESFYCREHLKPPKRAKGNKSFPNSKQDEYHKHVTASPRIVGLWGRRPAFHSSGSAFMPDDLFGLIKEKRT